MGNIVIRAEGLSKRYQLGTIGYGSLQHDLKAWWAKTRGHEDPNAKIGQLGRLEQHGEFWALRDVSLEIGKGDRLGIIGRNGAGKSTLLKLLSRVTGPTAGIIKVRGRIATLLEVGTGFHPELTGRENVFLNGAILGMKRREIQSKFDEIVDFAGVSQFIDTPVKRYSSGMYVRLAFSVAAHLDSEILIIDEVLAVGDAEFQAKCIGKMEDVSKGQGRTVLFVSHNTAAIQDLCNYGVVLSQGRLVHSGPIEEAVSFYSTMVNPKRELNRVWTGPLLKPEPEFHLEKVYCMDSSGKVVDDAVPGNLPVEVVVEFTATEIDPRTSIGIAVFETVDLKRPVFWTFQSDTSTRDWPKLHKGLNRLSCTIPSHFLNEGVYKVEVMASVYKSKWLVDPENDQPSILLEIRGGLSLSPYWTERRPGNVAPILEWKQIQ